MADDVGGAESVRLDEAVVEILGIPTNVLRNGSVVLLGIVVVELEAANVLAVDGHAVNGAVGSGGSSQRGNGAEGSNSLVHVEGRVCGSSEGGVE